MNCNTQMVFLFIRGIRNTCHVLTYKTIEGAMNVNMNDSCGGRKRVKHIESTNHVCNVY